MPCERPRKSGTERRARSDPGALGVAQRERPFERAFAEPARVPDLFVGTPAGVFIGRMQYVSGSGGPEPTVY